MLKQVTVTPNRIEFSRSLPCVSSVLTYPYVDDACLLRKDCVCWTLVDSGLVDSTLFISTVRTTVHTSPSRKHRTFGKHSLNWKNLKTLIFRRFVWTENVLKTEPFKKNILVYVIAWARGQLRISQNSKTLLSTAKTSRTNTIYAIFYADKVACNTNKAARSETKK